MALKHYDITRYRYPLDLGGNHPDNRIEHETHFVNENKPETRFITLQAGAFYTDTVRIYRLESQLDDEVTEYLTPNYYSYRHMVESAVKRSGKSVASLLVLHEHLPSGNYIISYQCVGGEYTDTTEYITGLVEEVNTTKKPVYYENLIGRPDRLYVPRHLHHWKDIHGAGPFYHLLTELLHDLKRRVMVDNSEVYARLTSIELEVDRLPKISRLEFEDAVNKIKDAVQSVDTLRTQLEARISDISNELGNRITQLQNAHNARLDTLEGTVGNHATLLTTLRSEVDGHETRLDQLDSFVNSIPVHQLERVDEYSDDLDRFSIVDNGWSGFTLKIKKSRELKNLTDLTATHSANITELGQRIDGVRTEIGNVDTKVAQNASQITALKDWRDNQLNPRLNGFDTSISDINNRIETLVDTVNDNQGSVVRRIGQLETKVPEIESDLTQYKQTNDAAVETVRNEITTLGNTVDQKEQALDGKIGALDTKLSNKLAEKEQALREAITEASAGQSQGTEALKTELLETIRTNRAEVERQTSNKDQHLEGLITQNQNTIAEYKAAADQRYENERNTKTQGADLLGGPHITYQDGWQLYRHNDGNWEIVEEEGFIFNNPDNPKEPGYVKCKDQNTFFARDILVPVEYGSYYRVSYSVRGLTPDQVFNNMQDGNIEVGIIEGGKFKTTYNAFHEIAGTDGPIGVFKRSSSVNKSLIDADCLTMTCVVTGIQSPTGAVKIAIKPNHPLDVPITHITMVEVTEAETLKKDVTKLKKDHKDFKDETEADVRRMSSAIDNLKGEIPKINAKIDDVKAEHDKLKRDHDQLSSVVGENNRDFRNDIETIRTGLGDVSTRVGTVENKLIEKTTAFNQLSNRVDTVNNTVTQQGTSISELNTGFENLRNNVTTTIPARINELDSKIDRITEEGNQETEEKINKVAMTKNFGRNLIADALFQDLDNWEAYDDAFLTVKNEAATKAIKTKFRDGIISNPDPVWYTYKGEFVLSNVYDYCFSVVVESPPGYYGDNKPDNIMNTTISAMLHDVKYQPTPEEMERGGQAASIQYREALENDRNNRESNLSYGYNMRQHIGSERMGGPDSPDRETFTLYCDGPTGINYSGQYRIAFKIDTQLDKVLYPCILLCDEQSKIDGLYRELGLFQSMRNENDRSLEDSMRDLRRNVNESLNAQNTKSDEIRKEIRSLTDKVNSSEDEFRNARTMGRNLISDPYFCHGDLWDAYEIADHQISSGGYIHRYQSNGVATGLNVSENSSTKILTLQNEYGYHAAINFVNNGILRSSRYWLSNPYTKISMHMGMKLRMSLLVDLATSHPNYNDVRVGLGVEYDPVKEIIKEEMSIGDILSSDNPDYYHVETLANGTTLITITLDCTKYINDHTNRNSKQWYGQVWFMCNVSNNTRIFHVDIHYADDYDHLLKRIKMIDAAAGNIGEMSTKVERVEARMTSVEAINTTQNQNIQTIQATANDALAKANQNKLDLTKELMDDKKEVGYIPIHAFTTPTGEYRIQMNMQNQIDVETTDGVGIYALSKVQFNNNGLRIAERVEYLNQNILSQAVEQTTSVKFRTAMDANTKYLNTRIVIFNLNRPTSIPLLATNADERAYITSLSIYKLVDGYIVGHYGSNKQRDKLINIIRGFIKAITLGARCTLIMTLSDSHDCPINAVVHYGDESYTHWIEHHVYTEAKGSIVSTHDGSVNSDTELHQIEIARFTEDLTQTLQYNTMLSNFLHDSRILDNHVNELTNDLLEVRNGRIEGWRILDRDKSEMSTTSITSLFNRDDKNALINLSNLDQTYWVYVGKKINFRHGTQNRRLEFTLTTNNPYVELDVSFVNIDPHPAAPYEITSLTDNNGFARVRPYHVGTGAGVTTNVRSGLYRLKYIVDINDTQARIGSGYFCVRPTTGTNQSIYSIGHFCLTDLRGTFRHNPAAQELNRDQIIGAIGDDIKSFVRQYITEQTSPAAAPTTTWNLSDFREQPGTEDWSEVREVNGKLVAKGVILHHHENNVDNVVFAPSHTYTVKSTQRWAIPKELSGRKALITVRANTLRQNGQVINSAVRQMFVVLPTGAVQITIGALTSFGQYLSVSNNSDYDDAIYPRSLAFGTQDIVGSVTIVV